MSDVTVNAIQTETKSVTPTISTQKVTPTSGKYLTEVSVGAIQIETKSVTSNGTYKPTNGKYFSSVTVNVPSETFNTQTKTVTPTESTQTVSPDNGYNGLSTVTVNPISSTYVGSGITRKSAATITPTTINQTINAGQYLSGAQTIKGDGNLVPENIISGKSIFGVSGSVVIQKYYTGTSDPSSSLGNDGDIYLKA